MSIKNLMRDKVDIYKLKKREGKTSYGVPSQDEYYYEDTPDYKDVKCSFQKSGYRLSIVQKEPFQEITETYNLYLPVDTDIDENDKVVFKNREYYAGIPFSYRNYIKVELERDDKRGKK